jgi:hypothetical protein
LSDLLAPRESAREATLSYNIPIITGLSDQSANKELKSGSLAPHCRRAQRGGNACHHLAAEAAGCSRSGEWRCSTTKLIINAANKFCRISSNVINF